MKHRHFIRGNSAFLSETIEILEAGLAPALSSAGWEESESPFSNVAALRVNRSPTASGLATIALAVGTWVAFKFADKGFDAVFDQTLKAPTESFVRNVLAIIRKHRNDAIEYQSLVYLEDLDLSILVRVVVSENEDIDGISSLINNVHAMANAKIRSAGKLAEIHCYTLVNGCCNLEPELFSDINQIKPSYPVGRRETVKIEKV